MAGGGGGGGTCRLCPLHFYLLCTVMVACSKSGSSPGGRETN